MQRRAFLRLTGVWSLTIALRDVASHLSAWIRTPAKPDAALLAQVIECGLETPLAVPMVIGWVDGCAVETPAPEPSLVPTTTASPVATAVPTNTPTPTIGPRPVRLPVVMDAYDGR